MIRPVETKMTMPNQLLGNNEGIENASNVKKPEAATGEQPDILAGKHECETCENRKYKDDSDDPSVSFQTPTAISPEQAPAAVLAHEYEHVRNEQAKADREGREVVYQSVVLHGGICPDCGKPYISGGETRTVTRGSVNEEDLKGLVLDTYA
ncbi:MAG: hypothetical protein D5S00_00610 [Tindallia sp. MSAO_Bac2]|nr:MAG: hypothetical protein D5S00_00610 [Tindallia sp. MSAO_Bac2]